MGKHHGDHRNDHHASETIDRFRRFHYRRYKDLGDPGLRSGDRWGRIPDDQELERHPTQKRLTGFNRSVLQFRR